MTATNSAAALPSITERMAARCANSGAYLETDAYQAYIDHAHPGMRWEDFEDSFTSCFE